MMRPQVATVINMLLPGDIVRNQEIDAALGGVAPNHRRVVVHHAKKRLACRGLPVRSLYGVGYQIGEPTRERPPALGMTDAEIDDYRVLRAKGRLTRAEALRSIGRGDLV